MKSGGLRTYAIDRVQTLFGAPHSAKEYEFLSLFSILRAFFVGKKRARVLFSNVG